MPKSNADKPHSPKANPLDAYCKEHRMESLDRLICQLLSNAFIDPKNINLDTIDLEDLREKGTIDHLGLAKNIHDPLLKKLLDDGVFTTH